MILDWDFISESLKYAKEFYVQQAQKYLEHGTMQCEGYRKTTYEPKIAQFDLAIQQTKLAKENKMTLSCSDFRTKLKIYQELKEKYGAKEG